MKQFLALLLLLLLTACQGAPAEETVLPEETALPEEAHVIEAGGGERSKPLETADEITTVTVPETPSTASFYLSRWDREGALEVFGFKEQEISALHEALPEVRGYALLENRAVPKDPWPIYTLDIGGVEEDFCASYCGGIWRDSQGNVLRAEVDFDGLWALFQASASEKRENEPVNGEPALQESYPLDRELALAGGNWDARFLRIAEYQDPWTALELTASGDSMDWTITNDGAQTLMSGDFTSALPQVQVGGKWYCVPILSGRHYGWNSVGIFLPPGETCSGTYWREPFGVLPDGNYRLALSCLKPEPLDGSGGLDREQGIAAAPFSIRGGKLLPAEE